MNESTNKEGSGNVSWKPLDRFERRVAGVLIEKSKTTPDVYPMTLNSIATACNQKSNRSPLMNLSPEEAADVLDRLRGMGAAMEVQGDGRVPRYKHLLYEWFGVDKAELAVLCELMLRGHQTIGDLRARVARMEPIAGQEELRPILQSLKEKGLLLELTPPGRGQVVSHNLYRTEELVKIRNSIAAEGLGVYDTADSESSKPETLLTSIESHGSPRAELVNTPPAMLALEQLRSRLDQVEEQLSEALRRIAQIESDLS